jgi:hypothetical protein
MNCIDLLQHCLKVSVQDSVASEVGANPWCIGGFILEWHGDNTLQLVCKLLCLLDTGKCFPQGFNCLNQQVVDTLECLKMNIKVSV